jgi:hypothetical protein
MSANQKQNLIVKSLLETMAQFSEDEDRPDLQNTDVGYSGDERILIPKTMTKAEAAQELLAQADSENKVVEKIRSFSDWHPHDALCAIMRVIEREFGWINSQTQSFLFFEEHPKEITIPTGLKTSQKCFLGQVQFRQFDDAIGEVDVARSGRAFIKIKAKKAYSTRIDELFEKINNELLQNSIYRNKNLVYHETNNMEFIENVPNPNIFLNQTEQLTVNYTINRINKKPDEKLGVLLSGDFGTGKTETAMEIGRRAVENGFTFIYSKTNDLAKVLTDCKKYLPAIILVEDMDELTAGARNEKKNDLLNTLDGVETKGSGIKLLMTTNDKTRINPAFRRPGRIDIVIDFQYPGEEAKIKMYSRLLSDFDGSDKLDYKLIASRTPEVQGALIKEIIERAIALAEENGGVITDEDVLTSIAICENQINFMKENQNVSPPAFDTMLSSLIQESVVKVLDEREE